MKATKVQRAVDDALAHVEALIAAANGDHSLCGVFTSLSTRTQPFTEAQRDSIRLYVQSWIEGPLRAALILLAERERWSTEEYVGMLNDSSEFGRLLEADAELAIEGSGI